MKALSGTVKVPGVGPVKKPVLLAGVAVTAAILAFAYYRRANAGAATGDDTSADTASDDYGVGGSDSYQPGSGGGGSGSSTPWPYGYDVNGNPLPAPVDSGSGTGGVTGSNSEWLTQAMAALTGAGVSEEVAGAALQGVLGGLGVTSHQEGLFLRAVGVLGNPPQGYPRPIRLISTPADPQPAPQPQPEPQPQQPAPQPTPEPTPAPTPAPAPAPKPAAPKPPAKPTGLKASKKGQTWIDLDWTAVSGADGYIVYRNGARITTVVYSNARVSGLKKNTSYTLAVQAIKGGLNSPLVSISAKTTK